VSGVTNTVLAISMSCMEKASERRRIGRPPLGPRKGFLVRLHPELDEEAKRKAHESGLTQTEYITALIAADTGRTDLLPGGVARLSA